MSDETEGSADSVEAAPEPSESDLFSDQEQSGAGPEKLFRQVRAMIDSGSDSGAALAILSHLRRRAGGEYGRKLDKHMLKKIAGFEQAERRLAAVHKDLKDELQQLLQPPYFPVIYIGPASLSSEVYATVLHEGSRRVVAFASGLDPTDLQPGARVYLCRERNAVIGKAGDNDGEIGEAAVLVRRLGENRLVLSDRDAEVVVSVGGALASETLRPGDNILWDRGSGIALDRLEKASTQGYEDIDETLPQQLGGMDSLREGVLARFIFAVLHPDTARRYGVLTHSANRLLLQGAPGTGKTTLMRVIASAVAREKNQHCRVVAISGAQLYSAYVGETERNIRQCFATLNDHEGPGIIFFDEIDAIGRIRGHHAGFHDDRYLGTLLAELEGMQRSDVAVIAATNRSDILDPALRSRFSWEIDVPRPGMAAAGQIFAIHLPEDLPYRPNSAEAPVTRRDIIDAGVARLFEPNADNRIASLQFRDGKRREIAARELVSGRLIEQVCTAARAAAFERECRGGPGGIAPEDMQQATAEAIDRLRRTLTVRNVKSFITDLPQDLDVVAVEAIQPRVDAAHYARTR